MQALTLARQRLRARIQSPSSPKPVRLAHNLVESGQSRYLPILSSPLAQDILCQGYDARTLERVYSNQPVGSTMVSRVADRLILDLPVHNALRERLQAAAGEICAAAVMAARAGEPEFRVLLAPCGLASEMLQVAERLRDGRQEVLDRMRFWGVDPDREGTLLREATRRTRAAGLKAQFIREDLRRHREVAATARREGPFHLVACLCETPKRSLAEVSALVRFYAGVLTAGGTLLIDRWEPAEKSRLSQGLGLRMQHHGAREFNEALRAAGFTIEREHPSGEGGCVLIVARKTN
jgi:hypothetical protein